MELNKKTFMQSKKATSAVVGSGAGILATILSSNIFPEGTHWWAPLVVALMVMLPNYLQIITQGIQDMMETYGMTKITLAKIENLKTHEYNISDLKTPFPLEETDEV